MDFIDGIIKPWLTDFITKNLSDMLASVNTQALDLGSRIIESPSNWSPTIWALISDIANAVIVPIAGIILTCVMCLELIGWINEKNNFHSSADVMAQLMKFIIKLGIGVLLVTKAQELTMGIFDMGAWAIGKSMGIIATTPDSVTVSMAALEESMKDAEIGTLMSLAFTSAFGKIGMWIIGIVVQLIVVGRMVEIYVYCSMGSAPYATLMNREISGIGQNYIKNLFALAFQGFFMLIMLGIYVALMQGAVNNISGSSAETLIGEILLISATLVMMLLRSKSIAKSIFSAQ